MQRDTNFFQLILSIPPENIAIKCQAVNEIPTFSLMDHIHMQVSALLPLKGDILASINFNNKDYDRQNSISYAYQKSHFLAKMLLAQFHVWMFNLHLMLMLLAKYHVI